MKKQCEKVVANTIDFFDFANNFKGKYLGENMSYRDHNDTYREILMSFFNNHEVFCGVCDLEKK